MQQTKEMLLEQENQGLRNKLRDIENDLLKDRVALLTNQLEMQDELMMEYQYLMKELKKTIKRLEQYIEVSNTSSFALEMTTDDLRRKLASVEKLVKQKDKEIEQLKYMLEQD